MYTVYSKRITEINDRNSNFKPKKNIKLFLGVKNEI